MESYALIRGVELFYTVHGDGPPLLILGAPGFEHAYLRPWLDPLGARHQLIFFDPRGCGRSQRGAFDEDTWVDDAEALRELLGLERVTLLGHGYGGIAAQQYAIAHPQRVEGLILVSTGPALDYDALALAYARRLVETTDDDDAFRALCLTRLPELFHRLDPRYRLILGALDYGREAFVAALRDAVDVSAQLDEIVAPAMIVSGRHDPLAPPELCGQALLDGIGEAELFVFERSGHFPFIEQPVAFLMAVSDWLAELGCGNLSHRPPAV